MLWPRLAQARRTQRWNIPRAPDGRSGQTCRNFSPKPRDPAVRMDSVRRAARKPRAVVSGESEAGVRGQLQVSRRTHRARKRLAHRVVNVHPAGPGAIGQEERGKHFGHGTDFKLSVGIDAAGVRNGIHTPAWANSTPAESTQATARPPGRPLSQTSRDFCKSAGGLAWRRLAAKQQPPMRTLDNSTGERTCSCPSSQMYDFGLTTPPRRGR